MLQKDPELTVTGRARNKNWRTTICEKAQKLPETSPTTGRKNGQCVGGTVTTLSGPLPSVGSPHPQSSQSLLRQRCALGSRVEVSVQQSLAGCLAQALPLILERWGGVWRSPWGADTGGCLDPGVGSAFRSPSRLTGFGTQPPPSPTSLWAPGLRICMAHGPTRKATATPGQRSAHLRAQDLAPHTQCTGGPRDPCVALQPEPSPREQQACFSLRTSLTQQQADAGPGHLQLCRLASRLAPVLGPAGPTVLPTCK